MSRARALAISAALAVCLSAVGYAPVPHARQRPVPAVLTGRWTVSFANGVVQTSELTAEGKARVTEPNRSSQGKAEINRGAVVIRFDDDRVERWAENGGQVVVEHWFPASAYPAGPKVLGAARRKP